MNKLNLKEETIETVKFAAILVLIIVVISLAFRFVPFLNVYHTYAIKTDSMEPTIMVGDVVIIKEIEIDDIKVGDIAAFYVDITNDGKDDIVVHYIDEIIPHGDKVVFKSKPEVSTEQDSWTLEESDIIGVYKFKVNNVGKFLLFTQTFVGKAVIIIDILIVSIIYDMFKKPDDKKKKKQDKKISKDDDIIDEIEINSKEKVSK